MKKLTLIFLLIGGVFGLNAQTCPTQTTWLGSGLLAMNFASDTDASTVFNATTTIDIDGCTNVTGRTFTCPTNLTDSQPISAFEIAGGGNDRIRPSGPTLWRNGGNGSFEGEVVFNLSTGQTLTCTFAGGALTSGVLPVELASFDARPKGFDVQINWTTAQEINSSYIAVERRSSVNQWDQLAKVDAQGKSSSRQNYEYIDQSGVSGVQYYRLKMVDNDGYFEYSEVRQVTLDRVSNHISVYPSTVSNNDFLNVDLTNIDNQKVTITAYSTTGALTNLGTYDSESILNLDLSELMPGLNVIQISGLGFSESHKIIVAK